MRYTNPRLLYFTLLYWVQLQAPAATIPIPSTADSWVQRVWLVDVVRRCCVSCEVVSDANWFYCELVTSFPSDTRTPRNLTSTTPPLAVRDYTRRCAVNQTDRLGCPSVWDIKIVIALRYWLTRKARSWTETCTVTRWVSAVYVESVSRQT